MAIIQNFLLLLETTLVPDSSLFLRTQGHSYDYISVYLYFPGINYSGTIKYSCTLFHVYFIRHVPQQEKRSVSSLVFLKWIWVLEERTHLWPVASPWPCAGCYRAQGLRLGTDHKQVTDLGTEVTKGCLMLLNLTRLYFNN